MYVPTLGNVTVHDCGAGKAGTLAIVPQLSTVLSKPASRSTSGPCAGGSKTGRTAGFSTKTFVPLITLKEPPFSGFSSQRSRDSGPKVTV